MKIRIGEGMEEQLDGIIDRQTQIKLKICVAIAQRQNLKHKVIFSRSLCIE